MNNKNNWYNFIFPDNKEVEICLTKVSEEITKLSSSSKIYLWPRSKERINLLYLTKCHSEDLTAIDQDAIKIGYKNSILEDLGYDLDSYAFTKSINKIAKYPIEQWSISKDNKLLHWGPSLSSLRDNQDLTKEAEKYASEFISLKSSSKKSKGNWYELYENYIKKFFQNNPEGWYKIDDASPEEILKQSKNIFELI